MVKETTLIQNYFKHKLKYKIMTKDEIINSVTKKHIKIYRLHLLELSNKDISALLKTNVGHVYNVLKSYKGNVLRISKAMQLVLTKQPNIQQ